MLFCGIWAPPGEYGDDEMSTPVKLRLYCSICARNDFYMDRIRAVADGLGLDYTLEKITDDDVIDRMDLLMPCLYAYCPAAGC